MGLCSYKYIFKAKPDKILGDIEGVKTYIKNIQVLSKDGYTKHIEELRDIFNRMWDDGLEISDKKCSFGLNNTP